VKRKKGNPKLWSVTHIRLKEFPHIMVRVTELSGSPYLYLGRQVDGKPKYTVIRDEAGQKVTRASLGKPGKEQDEAAGALGEQAIRRIAEAEKAPPTASAGGLTLRQLADRLERDGFKGCTAGYRRDTLASIRRIAAFLPADTPLSALKAADLQAYVADRLAHGMRAAARADLAALRTACNWAVEMAELLDVSPFARPGFKKLMPKKGTPRRPVATKDRYTKLKAVAPQVHSMLPVLLDVGWHSGKRIRAILGLKWDDVVLEPTDAAPCGTIRWYTGTRSDNKAREHVVAMNAEAQAALKRWRQASRSIGAAWVFPSLSDPTTPVNYHCAKKWLRWAETKAKVGHEKQGGWHMLRRGWATARKHFPIQDVAAVGAWLNTRTPQQLYQQADDETTLAVATFVA
jgi:integrase